MTSVDRKDAFFTVPVNTKFNLLRKYYQFVGLPIGDSDTIRTFKKILKPVFGCLKQEGYFSVIFVATNSELQY